MPPTSSRSRAFVGSARGVRVRSERDGRSGRCDLPVPPRDPLSIWPEVKSYLNDCMAIGTGARTAAEQEVWTALAGGLWARQVAVSRARRTASLAHGGPG